MAYQVPGIYVGFTGFRVQDTDRFAHQTRATSTPSSLELNKTSASMQQQRQYILVYLHTSYTTNRALRSCQRSEHKRFIDCCPFGEPVGLCSSLLLHAYQYGIRYENLWSTACRCPDFQNLHSFGVAIPKLVLKIAS